MYTLPRNLVVTLCQNWVVHLQNEKDLETTSQQHKYLENTAKLYNGSNEGYNVVVSWMEPTQKYFELS